MNYPSAFDNNLALLDLERYLNTVGGFIATTFDNSDSVCPYLTRHVTETRSVIVYCNYKDPFKRDVEGSPEFFVTVEALRRPEDYRPLELDSFDCETIIETVNTAKTLIAEILTGEWA